MNGNGSALALLVAVVSAIILFGLIAVAILRHTEDEPPTLLIAAIFFTGVAGFLLFVGAYFLAPWG